MRNETDILISVRGRFVDSMLQGNKRVELRRRAPRVAAPTRMWIYDTAPTASVRALAIVSDIKTLSPSDMWAQFGESLGLDESEYGEYVRNSPTVAGLLLCHIRALREPVGLKHMRELVAGFQPPQFYLRLSRGSPIVTRLTQEILCRCGDCSV